MSTQQPRQTVHSIHNKKFWTEFFYLYESLPALWDVNNPLYKNRQVKGDAYDIMVDKLREIEPAADRDDVLRKINIFRTNYRRECSRITLSLQEGRQYKSTLWYFDLLGFLRREKKRKCLDDGIEKTIMRKRRQNASVMSKVSNKFIVASHNGDLIEFHPNILHGTDMDYDNYEEPDFDYVVEDFSHSVNDNRNETPKLNGETLTMQQRVYSEIEENEEDHRTQPNYEHEFRKFAIHQTDEPHSSSNSQSSKIDTASEHMALASNMESDMGDEATSALIASDVNGFHSEDNMAAASDGPLTHAQWCLPQQNLPLQDARNILHHMSMADRRNSGDSCKDMRCSALMATRYVRDVKTMTTPKTAVPQEEPMGRMSESSEIIARSWAIQYEELTQDQKVLARKAINDILFEGCMGHLAIGDNGQVTSSASRQIFQMHHRNSKDLSHAQEEDEEQEVESGDIYEHSAPLPSSAATNTTNGPTIISQSANANDLVVRMFP